MTEESKRGTFSADTVKARNARISRARALNPNSPKSRYIEGAVFSIAHDVATHAVNELYRRIKERTNGKVDIEQRSFNPYFKEAYIDIRLRWELADHIMHAPVWPYLRSYLSEEYDNGDTGHQEKS